MRLPRVGVEEEFFLLDPRTGRTVPLASAVVEAVPEELSPLVQYELASCMIETSSAPHTRLEDLYEELARLRAVVSELARKAGGRLVATGCAPLEHSASGTPITDKPRYRRIAARYGAVVRGEQCCGCHVHVEVPDDEEAVQVSNHLRPWLPVLHALAANSPFTAGADSGYASWRSVALNRWPCVDIPPYFASAADYRATVAGLIASGAILDAGMLYWWVRRSHHLPTIEVRVADSCRTAVEAVLLAAIIRALVSTLLDDVRAGLPAPRPPGALLRAAYWRAGHDGLEGRGLDLRSARLVPAWLLVDRLLARIRPALALAGDLEKVTGHLERLRVTGSGAARQRAAYARRHDLRDVIDVAATES